MPTPDDSPTTNNPPSSFKLAIILAGEPKTLPTQYKEHHEMTKATAFHLSRSYRKQEITVDSLSFKLQCVRSSPFLSLTCRKLLGCNRWAGGVRIDPTICGTPYTESRTVTPSFQPPASAAPEASGISPETAPEVAPGASGAADQARTATRFPSKGASANLRRRKRFRKC